MTWLRHAPIATLLSLSLLLTASLALAQPPEIKFDVDSFARVIQPMKHKLDGRLPTFMWNFPLPRNDDLVKLRDSGELRKAIDIMAARGFVPTVELGWAWTPAGAMAMAKTLQEAKQPVCVLIPRADFLEGTCYANCKVWGEGPDASWGNKMRKWPCLPLADTKAGAAWLREQLKPFKDAGIKLAAVWFDDECLPHPWNGIWEAQKASVECRAQYPAGVMDDFGKFKQYCYDLRSKMFSEAAADPIHGMFPGAKTGNYSDFASSEAFPWYEGDNPYPPRTIGRMDAIMPSAYANTCILPRYFKADETVTQEKADQIYFHLLLRTVGSANANKTKGKVAIPYLSRLCLDNPDAKFRFGMTSARYRELLRHLWLRGTDAIYAFNLGYPGCGVSAEESFGSLEDSRAVYDELLEYRPFLDKGKPMNFDVPAMYDAGPVWSGLMLPDRCLVRAFTLGATAQKVTIEAFPGKRVELDAPPEGATYAVYEDGRVRRIGGGTM